MALPRSLSFSARSGIADICFNKAIGGQGLAETDDAADFLDDAVEFGHDIGERETRREVFEFAGV